MLANVMCHWHLLLDLMLHLSAHLKRSVQSCTGDRWQGCRNLVFFIVMLLGPDFRKCCSTLAKMEPELQHKVCNCQNCSALQRCVCLGHESNWIDPESKVQNSWGTLLCTSVGFDIIQTEWQIRIQQICYTSLDCIVHDYVKCILR